MGNKFAGTQTKHLPRQEEIDRMLGNARAEECEGAGKGLRLERVVVERARELKV